MIRKEGCQTLGGEGLLAEASEKLVRVHEGIGANRDLVDVAEEPFGFTSVVNPIRSIGVGGGSIVGSRIVLTFARAIVGEPSKGAALAATMGNFPL